MIPASKVVDTHESVLIMSKQPNNMTIGTTWTCDFGNKKIRAESGSMCIILETI